MLNFKKYGAHLRLKEEYEYPRTGSYVQWFIDATDMLDAKERLKLLFGIKYEVIDIFGPFDNLPVDQS